jgi:hypothetical protein
MQTQGSPPVWRRPNRIFWDHRSANGEATITFMGAELLVTVGSARNPYEFEALERLPHSLDEELRAALDLQH